MVSDPHIIRRVLAPVADLVLAYGTAVAAGEGQEAGRLLSEIDRLLESAAVEEERHLLRLEQTHRRHRLESDEERQRLRTARLAADVREERLRQRLQALEVT